MSRTVTARQLIVDAYGLIGVAADGESLTSDNALLGFRILNDLVDSYVTQPLTMLSLDRLTHTITANVADYTIGPGGDINTAGRYRSKASR
jgi:hypothetical protein